MLLLAPHRLQTPPRTVLKRFVISLHISILWKCPRDHSLRKFFFPVSPPIRLFPIWSQSK